jgi:hypothetical protein
VPRPGSLLLALAIALVAAAGADASDVARIKVVRGTVHVERAGQAVAAAGGTPLREGDVVVTGRDGAVGIAFADDSLLSAGPDTVLAIDRFAFDSTTHAGRHDTSLRQGTLSAVSGRIARQTPGAMTIRTRSTILGVRGTELAVQASPAP